MGLKINGSIINTIKINGTEICLGKINGETIFNAKVNNLVKKWRGDVTMVDYLEKKAKDKNKDFETVIYEDARWVIRQEQNKQK